MEDLGNFSSDIKFVKSEIKEELDWWVVRGIASDDSLRDSDGELIKVDGMDTSRVGVSSMFKYEHSDDDPGVFLGPIDKAEKINGKLILEGRLLKSIPAAVKVVTLMRALEKVGRKMRLSIEGKAQLRDPKDKSIILKSYLTNCSFTLMPKNKGTEVEIIKSENSKTNGGNIDCLVDIFNEETGEHVMVDKNYRIKIEKTDMKKTMSVDGNLSAIQKEDVESGKPKIFLKSETYNYIFKNFTTDIKKSKEIYSIIKETQQIINQDMENISEEAILKAKELLNIAKSESSKTEETKIEKSESKSEDEKEYEALMKKAEELKAKINGSDENGAEQKEEGKKKEIAPKKEDEKEEEDEKKVEKSEADDLFKSQLFGKIDALATLVESKDEAINDLKKSLGRVQSINEALSTRLKLVEDAPVGRMVQTTAVVDRFEKSEASKGGEQFKEVYSLKKDKEALLDRMYDLSNLKKGENVDHLLVKGFQNLECTRMFSSNETETQKIIEKLASHGIGLTE